MKPVVIVDAHWRRMDELFSPSDLAALHDTYDVVWGKNAPIPGDVLNEALPKAFALVAAPPKVTAETLAAAPKLKVIIEVEGGFPPSIDYAACAAKGVTVLSCAPGFRFSVAEMGLAMALGLCRGLVAEHEAFRTGGEAWLEDRDGSDFTLYGAAVGFVGFGSIARELHRLLQPFGITARAFDPWLKDADVPLVSLEEVLTGSQITFVCAAPSTENLGLLGAEQFAMMPRGAGLVVLSRAHLVDFPAMIAAIEDGHIRAATDVFPEEPVLPDARFRTLPGLILSPHRAAAVPGGRHPIGRGILADLEAIMADTAPSHLQIADPDRLAALTGVQNAAAVSAMAEDRT